MTNFVLMRIVTLFVLLSVTLSWSPKKLFGFQTKKVAATVIGFGLFVYPAYAYGPVEIPLKNFKYKVVELCDGRKPIMPGQKAMEGLFPVCVEVEVRKMSFFYAVISKKNYL